MADKCVVPLRCCKTIDLDCVGKESARSGR